MWRNRCSPATTPVARPKRAMSESRPSLKPQRSFIFRVTRHPARHLACPGSFELVPSGQQSSRTQVRNWRIRWSLVRSRGDRHRHPAPRDLVPGHRQHSAGCLFSVKWCW